MAVLLHVVVPQLGIHFAPRVAQDKVQIIAAFYVAFLYHASHDAEPLYLVVGGVDNLIQQEHPAHNIPPKDKLPPSIIADAVQVGKKNFRLRSGRPRQRKKAA